MADNVFISYAREDKEFVRRLHGELKGHERDTWVDWEDIPPTADWWAEVQRGIEAANAFVFIISPDSAGSVVCFREIEYAVERNKRVVPILHRDLSPDDERRLHPAINAHNWIFIRADAAFDTALNDLIVALDTDLRFVREHTALLVRARNWEQRERDPSLLLRELTLRDAEAWLT
ncbi:MAG: toll/interleukin-1 receptor domain-containing protein, partial [Anaerolineae bacterium]|nr:toll/interleukin-1 receptor domain-containing protein [Anaerolineae bacterium]